LISPTEFIQAQIDRINSVENTPGNLVQSAGESSFDAWIKAYRPNENSNNSTISYYPKGAVIAMALDLMLIQHTNGQKNLDDLMKQLYDTYYKSLDRGFTEQEFKAAAEAMMRQDLTDFFDRFINGTATVEYEKLWQYVGYNVQKGLKKPGEVYLGANLNNANVITFVRRNSPAYQYGLNVGDEIIAIDSKGFDNVTVAVNARKIGDKVVFKVKRDDRYLDIEVVLGENPILEYRFIPENKQNGAAEKRNFEKWLRGVQ